MGGCESVRLRGPSVCDRVSDTLTSPANHRHEGSDTDGWMDGWRHLDGLFMRCRRCVCVTCSLRVCCVCVTCALRDIVSVGHCV